MRVNQLRPLPRILTGLLWLVQLAIATGLFVLAFTVESQWIAICLLVLGCLALPRVIGWLLFDASM